MLFRSAGLGHRRLEEHRLRSEVLLDGAVQVEVVAPEVGEHTHPEVRSGDAVQLQGVRRHLHRDRSATLGDEGGELLLEVGCLRGGEASGERADDARF